MNADYLEIRRAYLAHYKTKGAKKGIRRFQSYEVAPNPSGYVSQEVGEAAAQSRRVGDDNDNDKKEIPESSNTSRSNNTGVKTSMKSIPKTNATTLTDKVASKLIDILAAGAANMAKNYDAHQLKQIESGKFHPNATDVMSKTVREKFKEKDPKGYAKWVENRRKYAEKWKE